MIFSRYNVTMVTILVECVGNYHLLSGTKQVEADGRAKQDFGHKPWYKCTLLMRLKERSMGHQSHKDTSSGIYKYLHQILCP